MDINDLRTAATVLCFIALMGVFFWALHPKRKSRFEQDGQLPFADDVPVTPDHSNHSNHSNLKGGGINE